jgi:hypothetical protein
MRLPRAQLRVFVPIETLPPPSRERWTRRLTEHRGLTRREHADWEAAAARRLLAGIASSDDDQALVRRRGDRLLVCPLSIDARAAWSYARFVRSVPEAVVGQFVPEALRVRLEATQQAGRVPYVLDEAWAVPFHWFLAFDPTERRLRSQAAGQGRRIAFVTGVGRARERIRRAVNVIEDSAEDAASFAAGASALVDWLDAFGPDALLELDYAGVAALFDPEQLVDDRTCAQVWEIVEALEAGDRDSAEQAYEQLRARWSGVWARQFAS